ncbi:MAG: hypothetical protein Q8Q82_06635, partial [Hydrogenophaga sp.]|nr:hypothetical protein [Hydrogenophaga sp.]
SGPAYTCGFTGLHNTSELLGIWPTLIPRAAVEAGVQMELLGETSPHAPPLRGSLPPEGAVPAWGGPAPDRA